MKKGDKERKNDYTCTAWKDGEKVNIMRYVHSVKSYAQWLDRKGIEWDYINVYWRRSGDFERRVYFNE